MIQFHSGDENESNAPSSRCLNGGEFRDDI